VTHQQTATSDTSIVVVDDTPDNLRLLAGLLAGRGYRIRPAASGPHALAAAREELPDLILLDIRMPEMDGYEVCKHLKADERTRDIPIIFISALHEAFDKVKAFALGGVDYITKPFQAEEVLARVETHLALWKYRGRLEELVEERTSELTQAHEQLQTAFSEIQQLQEQLQAENIYFREELEVEHNFDRSNGGIIGQSEALNYLLHKVEHVAPTDTTVLILGETGTGKELIARALHHAGLRNDRPLVKVNCAALPTNLIESELFGHEKGAFTGATAKRLGRFELAHGATVFLDEIGELPIDLQVKLLRVLQEAEFERLGSSRTITVDVRVIAATNRDLEQEVQAGRFRRDLYYRLNVYPLSVPPLRERSDDIPLLVQAFARAFGKKLGKRIEKISPNTMTALQQYAWPGNIRELQNVIERAVITTQDTVLRIELPENLSIPDEGLKTLDELERDYIIQILELKRWRISGPKGAAAILGLNAGTLRSRMQKLGIRKPE